MTNSSVAAPAKVPKDLRWLRRARAIAFSSLFLFLTVVILAAFFEAPENGGKNLLYVLSTAPLWLPYLWMLLRMRAKTAKSQKKGLALAIAYGSWALIVALPSAFASFGLALQAGFAIFASLQLLLIMSGMKTYYAMEKEPGDKRILINRIASVSACLGILLLAAIYIPCLVKNKVAANESASISAVRTICTAQSSYAEKYPQKGLATSLSELGPPPGADLIDQQLASGAKSGYTFTMIAGPPGATGHIAQYSVIARPLTFGQTGRRSSIVDASCVIRSTEEDRAPTMQDRTFP